MDASNPLKSDRSKVKRAPKRGHYDRETFNSVLDAHYLCQIAFVHKGTPHVIPTLYARDGDRVLIPMETKAFSPITDPDLKEGISVPKSVRDYRVL